MGRRFIAFMSVCATIVVLYVWSKNKTQDQSLSRVSSVLTSHQYSGRPKRRPMRQKQGKNSLRYTYQLSRSKTHSFYSKEVEAERQHFANIQERLARVTEQCALIKNPDQKRDVAKYPPESLIVNEEHRIIYCNVPKVGCTNWKTIFMKLEGYDKLKIAALDRLDSNKKGRIYLDYLHKYTNISQRRFMLQNYTKFVFVRHPFTRILSAFRNKLAPNISSFTRNGDGEAERWFWKYGRQIIERYRGEEEAERVSSNWSKEYDLRFSEFIRFLVDPDTDSYNNHWSDINSLCLPCDIDYDVIGKYETLDEDAEFVLRLAKVDPKIKFPPPNPATLTNSSDGKLVDSYYKDVPKLYLYQLAKLYNADFEIFGYDPVSFLNM